MFCTKCGSEIPDGSKFCTKCGASVKADTAVVGNHQMNEPVVAENGGTDNSGVSLPQGGVTTQEPEKRKKKKSKVPFIIAGAVILLAGICFALYTFVAPVKCLVNGHKWEDATCTEPKTCSVCGKTEGEVAEHKWQDAICEVPKTCSACGKTEGAGLKHIWVDSTCTTPVTCSLCGETRGGALGHKWQNATCTTPKTCRVCGETEGSPNDNHDWIAATLEQPKQCRRCHATEGEPLKPYFEREQIQIMAIEGQKYDFRLKDQRDDSNILKAYVSFVDYQIASYDDELELEQVDGYEWRIVAVKADVYESENMFYTEVLSHTVRDYYIDTRYGNVLNHQHGILSKPEIEVRTINNPAYYENASYFKVYYAIRVPVGYDGVVVGLLNKGGWDDLYFRLD